MIKKIVQYLAIKCIIYLNKRGTTIVSKNATVEMIEKSTMDISNLEKQAIIIQLNIIKEYNLFYESIQDLYLQQLSLNKDILIKTTMTESWYNFSKRLAPIYSAHEEVVKKIKEIDETIKTLKM